MFLVWLLLTANFPVHSGDLDDCLTYRDAVVAQNLVYTAYYQYRNGWQARKERIKLYKTAQALTTPYPRLGNLFFENETKVDPKDSYLSLSETFGPTHTVDDDIGMPLNQPINKTTWGAYRSHLYFGLRQRTPRSPLFGMMWYEQPDQREMPRIRHWCDQGDGLSRYGWTEADGRTFGRQNITERTAQIKVDWLNNKDTWTAQVSVNPLRDRRFNFIFYLASQNDRKFKINDKKATISSNNMRLVIKRTEGTDHPPSSLVWDSEVDLKNLNDKILMNTGIHEISGKIVYTLHPQREFKDGTFAALQFYVTEKATFEISMSTVNNALTDNPFVNELAKRRNEFEAKYEKTFHVKGKGFSQVALDMGKVALSNMLGSLGYWYGSNKALEGNYIVPYGPHELFSAVPSRPFFPRGFLWDEGFHNLLIQKFNPDITVEIVISWLNTINEDGWIPREMILGEEAEAKVPVEFVTQFPNNANPPSMFLVMEKLLNNEKIASKYSSLLAQIFPKLERWYSYLMKSQKGKKSGTMRWRGRNSTTDLELNPKTLASGLDDYPRASHPSHDEYHLDLRCWMAVCSRVMSKLAQSFGDDAAKKKYSRDVKQFSDYQQLKQLHWSEKENGFFDFGLHSAKVDLVREVDRKNPEQFIIKRKSILEPRLHLVDDAFGYNSLYPLIFHLIPVDAPELHDVLTKLKDPEEVWTEFGLRSLSAKSRYYAARNTEHDPPYWRGYIWINLNYLVLSALHHYASVDGPYQKLSHEIMVDLRLNIIRNMAIQFNRTGYLWENYDDRTGEGHGTHPFTGWSSLVLLIMDDDILY